MSPTRSMLVQFSCNRSQTMATRGRSNAGDGCSVLEIREALDIIEFHDCYAPYWNGLCAHHPLGTKIQKHRLAMPAIQMAVRQWPAARKPALRPRTRTSSKLSG